MDVDMRKAYAPLNVPVDRGEDTSDATPYDRVVDLLNEASLSVDSVKVSNLKQVQELIVHKDPNLLDNFLDEMLAFQADKSVEVKKCIIGFMEEACKQDNEILSKVIGNLNSLLLDNNVALTKKVILSLSSLYSTTLKWLLKSKILTEVMEQTWKYINSMKDHVLKLVDDNNDGIRTHAIKFAEALIVILTPLSPDSELPKKKDRAPGVDDVPDNHGVLKRKKLEEEGARIMQQLLELIGSQHITSVNLITCLSALTNIAKQRPLYMSRIVQSFESLHVNLPPTLASSQVNSVRKNLKLQMLSLLRHPASYEHRAQMATLLTDLGATQNEVMKNMPKEPPPKKRKADVVLSEAPAAKRPESSETPRDDDDDEDGGATPFVSNSSKMKEPVPIHKPPTQQSAVDITVEDIIPCLTAPNVADLVLLSMVLLPEAMPSHFLSTYTPIAAAGTQAQIKHLARLLAVQLTAAGLGKGVQELKDKAEKMDVKQEEAEDGDPSATPGHSIQTLVGRSAVGGSGGTDDNLKVPPKYASRKSMRAFSLAAITKPFDADATTEMLQQAVKRLLNSEKSIKSANMSPAFSKILAGLVAQFDGALKTEFQQFIFEDLRGRQELAFAWLYQEYANYQCFVVAPPGNEKPSLGHYDDCITRLLSGLLDRPDQREGLFSRLLLEAPHITPNAVLVLKKYCQDESRVYLGMSTLRDLILKRPNMQDAFLNLLLEFTHHDKSEVRNNAIRVTKKLFELDQLGSKIETYSAAHLQNLVAPHPTPDMFPALSRTKLEFDQWTEETVKMCLYLYLGLMPQKHSFIHELANVYIAAQADIKRIILRVLENPVKSMGMHSPELLRFVEACPKGAETLVTRVIHILTEKAAPSAELVDRVRDLYVKRVSDVRFLIPVLTGLQKREILAALPKMVKLNPAVVKEVFNRLLGIGSHQGQPAPLTPAELLIALHSIDPNKCDVKVIIKATTLCFQEKAVYTQEVLAVVIQQLMDQNPLPTLFMRTVIQSLSAYPRLMGFVMNILQRLITKQVWKQRKVWEGFVKCCQRTRTQSFQVLLQLPAAQMRSAIEIAPDLREPLLAHVQAFTPHQRAHIPKAVIAVLEKEPEPSADRSAQASGGGGGNAASASVDDGRPTAAALLDGTGEHSLDGASSDEPSQALSMADDGTLAPPRPIIKEEPLDTAPEDCYADVKLERQSSLLMDTSEMQSSVDAVATSQAPADACNGGSSSATGALTGQSVQPVSSPEGSSSLSIIDASQPQERTRHGDIEPPATTVDNAGENASGDLSLLVIATVEATSDGSCD